MDVHQPQNPEYAISQYVEAKKTQTITKKLHQKTILRPPLLKTIQYN